MRYRQFSVQFILLLLIGQTLFAQEHKKEYAEKFYTNKDVSIDIDASNTEIEVISWDKNEVSIKNLIKVEGVDKKEAEKYFENSKLKATGNKSNIRIEAVNNGSLGNDRSKVFVYNSSSNDPNVIFLEGDVAFEIPEIPEIPEIHIPEINIDDIVTGLEDITFDFEKYTADGDTYFFKWKDGVNDITIKSKKEWEAFKKTPKYKKLKKEEKKRIEELKRVREKLRAEREKRSVEKKKQIVERKKQIALKREKRMKAIKERKELREKKIAKEREERREEIQRMRDELRNVRESLRETHRIHIGNHGRVYHFSTNGKTPEATNGKKVKITNKIIIKVPKEAQLNLNTRHCKVKLPKTKVNGKVSYGAFKAENLEGGKLEVSFSPVTIQSLNNGVLFLNNVADAKIASVTNTLLDTKSSEVLISNLKGNVELINSYGGVQIKEIEKNASKIKVYLNYATATVNTAAIDDDMVFSWEDSSGSIRDGSDFEMSIEGEGKKKIKGSFILKTKDKKVQIKGKYTQLTLHK